MRGESEGRKEWGKKRKRKSKELINERRTRTERFTRSRARKTLFKSVEV